MHFNESISIVAVRSWEIVSYRLRIKRLISKYKLWIASLSRSHRLNMEKGAAKLEGTTKMVLKYRYAILIMFARCALYQKDVTCRIIRQQKTAFDLLKCFSDTCKIASPANCEEITFTHRHPDKLCNPSAEETIQIK